MTFFLARPCHSKDMKIVRNICMIKEIRKTIVEYKSKRIKITKKEIKNVCKFDRLDLKFCCLLLTPV